MKKNLFIALTLLSAFAFSQNKQIIFETGNFASVLAKAEKENKLILQIFTFGCDHITLHHFLVFHKLGSFVVVVDVLGGLWSLVGLIWE